MALSFRRMHDVGKPGCLSLGGIPCGVLFLISLDAAREGRFLLYLCEVTIPVGFLVYYISLLCKDSQPGTNQHGPNPKEIQEAPKSVYSKGQTTLNTPDETKPTTEDNSQSTVMPVVMFCKQCGAKREKNSKFCMYCGNRFE